MSDVLTIKDLMERLRISKNVAYDLIKQEGFPVIKIKSTYRIPKQGLEKWLDKFNMVS